MPVSGAILRGRTGGVVVLLLIALLFGGGGSGAGIANMVVQLAGLAALAFNRQAVLGFFAKAPKLCVVLVAASLLLPLLQLVPLPPALWQALPGRDLVVQSLDLIGKPAGWRPFSLSVSRTAIAFFSLLAPLAILTLSWDLAEEQKRTLLQAVAAAGIIVVMLGAQQLATGNRFLVFYSEVSGSRDLQGTFSNRNTGGLMLDIALVALVAAVPWRRTGSAWKLGAIAMAILLVVGVVLTRSRSGMMLLAIPAAQACWTWQGARAAGRGRGKAALALLGILLLVVAGGALLSGNQRLQQSLARFDSVEDEQRPAIWHDTLEATRRYWPVGSGIGSFEEVFQVDEALENLSYGRAGRAHNDFLEVALESGAPGILLLAGWIAMLAVLVRQVVRRGGPALAAVATFALIAFQSLTDYPLRSQTLLCIAALMLALLLNTERVVRDGGRNGAHDPMR